MPDVRELQKVLESAEQAAAAGDIASAEALLREAAELQEASHGPLHPDLASTVNNLAVVCEMAHKPIEAEQFYRRAYAIASWSLSPGHPMVATARDNLRDFCAARGLPIDEWMDLHTGAHVAPPAPVAATVVPSSASAAPAVQSAAVPARVSPPAPTRATAAMPASAAGSRPAMPTPPLRAAPGARRGLSVAMAILAVLAVLAIARQWRTPASDGLASPSAVASAAPPALDPVPDAAPQPAPFAVAPAPTTVAPPATAVTPAPAPALVAPPAAASVPSEAPDTLAGVRVVTATVCSELTTGGAWRCTPAGATPKAGRLSYYTRVASSRGLRVQHRWYQDGRLRQDVALNLNANAVGGYRTFSRQTVAPGEWRVELRAENGAVLDEARFVVR